MTNILNDQNLFLNLSSWVKKFTAPSTYVKVGYFFLIDSVVTKEKTKSYFKKKFVFSVLTLKNVNENQFDFSSP